VPRLTMIFAVVFAMHSLTRVYSSDLDLMNAKVAKVAKTCASNLHASKYSAGSENHAALASNVSQTLKCCDQIVQLPFTDARNLSGPDIIMVHPFARHSGQSTNLGRPLVPVASRCEFFMHALVNVPFLTLHEVTSEKVK
jgi:hypothetical protein